MMLAVAPGCSDDDEADDAVDEGETSGEGLAAMAELELGPDLDQVIVGKSGAIVLAIDEAEILHAQFAIANATDTDVIAYAATMIEEHAFNAEQTRTMLVERGVEPIDNQVAANLRAQADAGLAELERSVNLNFDYLRMQVRMHAEAHVIVDRLVDLAPFGDVEVFLGITRSMIAEHREEAIVLLRSL